MSDKNCVPNKDDHFQFASKDGQNLSQHDKANQEAHQAAAHLFAESRQLTIPSGGGPFQAIKCEIPNISNQGASVLAGLINEDTGRSSYNAGDKLDIPKNLFPKSTDADSKVHMPYAFEIDDFNGYTKMAAKIQDRLKPNQSDPYDYKGSLVGRDLLVDQKGDGFDFKTVYPGADPNATYKVTRDNEGKTLDGSGIRDITLVDGQGKTISGSASRFMFPEN